MKADLAETTRTQVALDRQDYTTDVLTLSNAEQLALRTQVRILANRLLG